MSSPSQKAYQARWYQENRARILANKRSGRASDPERYREYDRKNDAKRPRKLRDYGLFSDDYERMWAACAGCCEICGEAMKPSGTGGLAVAIDHDHSTGRVRGLLHAKCNQALGALGDDLAGIKRVVAYLSKGEL